MNLALQHLRVALRSAKSRPSMLVIVTTLVIALGGSTAIFTFVDDILLRPLAFPDAERLVMLCEQPPEDYREWCSASPANLADWRRQSRSVSEMALARGWHMSWSRDGRIVGVASGVATHGFPEVFGVEPFLGRAFAPSDSSAGASPVVLLGYGLWHREFDADGDVVGTMMTLDGVEHQVIGVLPAGLEVPYLEFIELWTALWPERAEVRDWRGFIPYGRLADGFDLAQAQAEFDVLAEDLATSYPEANAGWTVSVESLHERLVRPVRPALVTLLAAVVAVLLVASSNIASLLLARARDRESEFALRLAVGAERRQLAGQLAIEGLLVAVVGAVGGSLLAIWLVDLFVALAPADLPRLGGVRLDGRSLAFAWAAAFVIAPVLSCLPLIGFRAAPGLSLRSRPGSQRRNRTFTWLLLAQLSLSLALLVDAGLLVRSFVNRLDWQPGFELDHLALFSLLPPHASYPTADSLRLLYERVGDELSSLPGVVSVGNGSAGPLFGGDGDQEYFVAGRPEPPDGSKPTAYWFDVGPGYFETFGIELVRGRSLGREHAEGPTVAVVNEAFVRQAFGSEDPLGQEVHLEAHEMMAEIVGVVRDVPPFEPGAVAKPEIYWSDRQHPRWATHFVVRTDEAGRSGLREAVQSRLTAVDADLEIGRFFSLADQIDRRLVSPRFHTTLVMGFTALALLIAGAGVYGAAAFRSSRRLREYGVRLALGAERRDLLNAALAESLRLGAVAVVAGCGLAYLSSRGLGSLLVGVEPGDGATMVVASLLLLGACLVASWAPVARSTRVDPVEVLRAE